MRKIENQTVFPGQNPPLVWQDGDERVYYAPNLKVSHVYDLPFREDLPLSARAVFQDSLQTASHYRRNNSASLSIEYVTEGSLYVRQNESVYEIGPGEIFLMRPGCRNEFLPGEAGFCVKSSVVLIGRLLGIFMEENRLTDVDVITDTDIYRFENLISSMKELSGKYSDDAIRRNEILCYEILQFLREPHPEQNIPEEFGQLISYLEKHLAEEVSLEKMASLCGISRASLLRSFRRYFGISPHQMLIRLRMRKAARLLQTHPELSIKEITLQTGYANSLNFSTAFRSHFNESPRTYRKRRLYRLY